MATLLIMRHAKSDWTANVADFDRPLNKRGLKNAKKMGAWLKKKKLVPDVIVSSPARRTRQTIGLVCEQLGKDVQDIVWDDHLYETGLAELLQVIKEHGKNARRMLVMGHNPGLDYLVNHLSKNRPPHNITGKLMTTAAIAVLDFGEAGIDDKQGSAKVVKMARPKEI